MHAILARRFRKILCLCCAVSRVRTVLTANGACGGHLWEIRIRAVCNKWVNVPITYLKWQIQVQTVRVCLHDFKIGGRLKHPECQDLRVQGLPCVAGQLICDMLAVF